MPSVPNQPKTAEIPTKSHPKCIKNAHRGNNKLKKKFSGGGPPNPPYERGLTPSGALPQSCLWHSLGLSPDHFLIRGDGPVVSYVASAGLEPTPDTAVR